MKKRLLALILSFFLLFPMSVAANGEEQALPFIDVTQDKWFFDAVSFVYKNKIMAGMPGNVFEPNTNMTRAMYVTLLGATYPFHKDAYKSSTFTDVAPGSWYTSSIGWAARSKIVSGYGDTFGCNDSITREQIVTILYNYTKFCGYKPQIYDDTLLNGYYDSDSVNVWAREALNWALNSGIIKGTEEGILSPRGYATRAQVAQIMYTYNSYISSLNIQERPFEYGKDNFSFENSPYDFFHGEDWKYSLNGIYYTVFFSKLPRNPRLDIIDLMKSQWNGACFGMSCVVALTKAGLLDPSYFQEGATNLYDLNKPKDSETVTNLINFYHLSQAVPSVSDQIWDPPNPYDQLVFATYRVKKGNIPVILNISFTQDNSRYYHSVVAFDAQMTANGYTASVWDPNIKDAPLTMYIDTTGQSATLAGYNKLKIEGLVTDESRYYCNLQEKLMTMNQQQ